MAQWTEAQCRAIETRGTNLLVSAGAGAGKTAVLVERIIRKVSDLSSPIDVDRILVVTFTNAAAAEMRERISAALTAKLKETGAEHLSRQLALMGKASITTLHSFCLEIVRQNFFRLGLDPGFRVADEAECALMRVDIITDLLEERYQSLEPAFLTLVEGFGGKNSDSGLQGLILSVAEYALSQPEPLRWLQQAADAFRPPEDAELTSLSWYGDVRHAIRSQLTMAIDNVQGALVTAAKPHGPAHYTDVLEKDLNALRGLLNKVGCPWDEIRDLCLGFSFDRLPTKRGYESPLKEVCQGYREKAKKHVQVLRDQFFSQSERQVLDGIRAAIPQVTELTALAADYLDLYRKAKLQKGIVDFSDLEHMALSILKHNGEPSAVAMELKARFAEVFVDEYQDINAVQETVLQMVSRNDNMFLVGDVKQSIYRFRLADPSLFRAKETAYSKHEANGINVHLSHNFRSRPSVIHCVNYLFQRLMSVQGVGEVAYGEGAALVAGADYPPGENTASPQVELCLLDRRAADGESEEDVDATSREATAIAHKISSLVEGRRLHVWDKSQCQYRPVEYRDIVILMRATRGRAEVYSEIFQQLNIPLYSDSLGGYFRSTEVSNLLSALKVIDNPRQDIPLAALLRSPLVGLNVEELAEIRLAKSGGFWDCVLAASATSTDLGQKLQHLLIRLTQWRDMARRGGLPELLMRIYEDTGYYFYVGSLPGGRQRQANLRALYDRACQYEATVYRGLFKFLRFIQRLQDQEGDLATPGALGENDNVVRVMSIHKSKGLEFPVVFVAGLGNRFNLRDLSQPVLIHKQLGLGPQVVDMDSRCLYPSLPRLAIKHRLHGESLSEELRVLYVALTRAREKLYLVASLDGLEEAKRRWLEQGLSPGLLPVSVMESATCYMDWLGPACFSHATLGGSHADASLFSEMSAGEEIASDQVSSVYAEELDRVSRLLPLPDHGYSAELNRKLNWSYPYLTSSLIPAKISVSDLKRRKQLEDDEGNRQAEEPLRPQFVRRHGGLTAAEIGTALHMFMQHVDLGVEITTDYLAALRRQMTAKKLLTDLEAEHVDLERVIRFFNSDLGKRLQASPKVWRELPFSLRTNARRLNREIDKDFIYVQGIIDCVFLEGEQLILLDYKSDWVSDASVGELCLKYAEQLDLYRDAVETLLRRKVAERYLYLFALGRAQEM